jgi:4-hydroxy-tetrahydrodipicolinate reductase
VLDITLIGYGKMGRMVESLAPASDCRVRSIVDPLLPEPANAITADNLVGVCIEFSHPSAVLDNIRRVAEAGRHLVVGTTGWLDHLGEAGELAEKYDVGILYGANFSIGMNIFNRVVEYAAGLCDRFPAYDVFGYELHHNQKADSPSGTALQLADTILKRSSRKQTPVYDKLARRIEPGELHFASIRAGAIPGTHTVGFDSESDTIELTHRVRSRSCFAAGALQGAHWIAARKGLHSFAEMMESLLC